jgi:hypothetical protein
VELRSFGSDLCTRDDGAIVRRDLERLLASLEAGEKLRIDFYGVQAITPSFADEAIAKFIADIGVDRFKATVTLRIKDETVRVLVRKVVAERMARTRKRSR